MRLLHRLVILIAILSTSLCLPVPEIKADEVTATLGPLGYWRHLETVPSSPSGHAGEVPTDPGGVMTLLPLRILPSAFIPNMFDEADPIRFIAQGMQGALLIKSDSLTFAGSIHDKAKQTMLRYIDANEDAKFAGAQQLEAKANFFQGDRPSLWQTDVPMYGELRVQNLYPGIDVTYRINSDGLIKREFLIHPGADSGLIQMRFVNTGKPRIRGDGTLLVTSQWGVINESAPVAYQSVDGTKTDLPIRYTLMDDGVVRFEIGDYDHSQPLTIDPYLSFSTYLGSKGRETGDAIAVAKFGYIYVTGNAHNLFPYSPGGYQQFPNGMSGTFVAKFDPSGSKLLYVALISGGISVSSPAGIAVDGVGNAYITGYTNSGYPGKSDFPVVNAYDTTFNGNFDAFLLKLSPSGNKLLFSTYLGSKGQDFGHDIAIDANGNAYVAGSTTSSSFPITSAAYQKKLKGQCDAFVSMFTSQGGILYITYFGGSGGDKSHGVALDKSGGVYLTGWTKSSDFPVKTGALFTKPKGVLDAYVAKLAIGETATTLAYGTYLGGTKDDYGEAIDVDSNGNAYIVGGTSSTDFPKKNAFGSKFGGGKCPTGWKGTCPLSQDGFLSALNPDGTKLIYSTLLGGEGYDVAHDVAAEPNGDAYAAGWTASTSFPLKSAIYNKQAGQTDAYLLRVSAKGALVFSSFFGGSDYDYGTGVATDSIGNAYLTGTTESTRFPIKNALDPDFNHKPPLDYYTKDAFLTKVHVYDPKVKTSGKKTVLDWMKSWWDKLKDLIKKN